MKKLLITGSSGMVGRNIIEHKKAHNYRLLTPTSAELNLLDKNAVDSYIKAYKPDIVVHCAGLVGGIIANMNNLDKFLTQNALMALNLINSCFESGIKNLLNITSSCIYPRNAPNPLNESSLLSGAFEPTNEGYALAKVISLKLCEYISGADSSYLYKTIIPCNLYGKYDKFDTQNAHLIPAVIAKIHSAKANGASEISIWGDGRARREFMYAWDLADFVFYALEHFEALPQNLNVGLGVDYTIDEYYRTIAEIIGFSGKFSHDLDKPVGMERKCVDIANLKSFGWCAKTSLESGIKQTYQYYLQKEKAMTNSHLIRDSYPLASSTWDDKEIRAINEVIKSNFFTMGAKVAEFERDFAKFIGSKYAVMTSSGSTANLIATAALFYTKNPLLKRGDEVIVPAVSWSTTYYPLFQYGLKLKFVDIDLETLNYDLDALQRAISDKTKMIMCVNLLGNPNDFNAINAMIKDKNIILLEDNCESMGATYNDRFAGTFGIMGTFSTFYSHHIATMEGGIVVTDNEELYHILLCLRAHGWTRNLPKHNLVSGVKSDDDFSESFKFVLPGYNVRPVEMSGAIGVEQLKKLPSFLEHRKKNAKHFVNLFKDNEHFIIQKEIGQSSWFGFAFILKSNSRFKRSDILRALREANIEYRPIVTGDFTQNEVIKYFDYEIFGEIKNAKYMQENGFFVGNHHADIKAQITTLAQILNSTTTNGGGKSLSKIRARFAYRFTRYTSTQSCASSIKVA